MTQDRPETRERYPHRLTIPTRWMDNDLYGHVNNVVYYSYFDTLINQYLIEAGGLDIHEGAVVGVAIAASPRRGRVTSAAPRSLAEVMARAEVAIAEAAAEVPGEVKVAPSNYAGYGDHLRAQLSVAKVLCWSERAERRRRPPLR